MYQNLPKARVNNFFGKARLANGRGFTLVEVLVASAIISIAGLALVSTVSSILRVTKISQDTIRAQSLANEKIEVLKNMPYDELATQNGAILPQGNIPDVETVTSGGHNYVVHTFISFVDDPFDGNSLGTIPLKPVDFYPFDYKKATIEVRDSIDSKVLVKISTNIAANAAETSDGTGILFLQVVDSQGLPVANADVHLTNTNPVPDLDITTITDINGLLQIPLLPEDTGNNYHLEVSLPGYSTDQTYPDDQSGYDPVQPDFNILAQQVTNITLAIDLVSTLNISVEDETGSPAPLDFDVTVVGAKTTHEDPFGVLTPIYKYNQTLKTDSSGNITIANLEWDDYSFSLPTAGWFIISTTPYQPVIVPPNSTVNVTLKMTADSAWPRINQVTPISGVNTGTVNIEVLGANLPVGATMKLTKSGETDINATGVISSDGDTRLNGDFNLSGAATGVWNLVVTASGKTTTQTGGFTISAS